MDRLKMKSDLSKTVKTSTIKTRVKGKYLKTAGQNNPTVSTIGSNTLVR